MTQVTIPKSQVFYSQSLGPLDVMFSNGSFTVRNEKKEVCKISTEDLSQDLKDIDRQKLEKLAAVGTFTIRKIGDQYGLRYNVTARGGGPVAGMVAYWVTKAAGYGAIAGAATAATVTVAGGAAVGGATSIIAGEAIAGATGIAATASTGVGGAVATAVANSPAAVAAAGKIGTALAAMEGAGAVATVTAGIEGTAMGVGGFFAAVPFLP